jgi:hypothetical protein
MSKHWGIMPPWQRSGLHRRSGQIDAGIFSNEEAIVRLVGAILLEQNSEWSVQRARYVTLETHRPTQHY